MEFGNPAVVFVQEARDLLAGMEAALLEIEAEGANADRINATFRAAHTIKGAAGLLGLELLVSFTQVLESVLDRARNGTLSLEGELAATLLRCSDYMGSMVDAVEAGTGARDPDPTLRSELISLLERNLTGVEHGAAVAAVAPNRGIGQHWHISVRFAPTIMKSGMDPIAFFVHLRTLGQIVYLHTISDSLPPLDLLDAELCYLGFELGLETTASRETLEGAFALVRDDAKIRILSSHASPTDYIALIESMPESHQRLGEILLAVGALTRAQLDAALAVQAGDTRAAAKPRLGEVLVEQRVVPAAVVTAALGKQKQAEDKRHAEQRVVKVDAAKLDQLINWVGELVIASEGARISANRAAQRDVLDAMSRVADLVEHIRDRALDLRMVPIGEVFQRFPRVVRDVSKELGKQIELVISGADAELDKSMVDKLVDPLLHIVRNAIDHGIEPVPERLSRGKPAQGQLRLHAFHESGCIVIEVSDDGRGLHGERILAKAIERGLLAPNAVLGDVEIQQLIFLPGFSTADAVTNLSGRGVGMDVVKRSVERMRGEIEIESNYGEGTVFRIRLPLTLAIIDGFQVAVGKTVFVIPLDTVIECVDLRTASRTQGVLNLRGEPLPYLRLRDLFKLGAPPPVRESIVVVAYGHQRIGLVVDRLLGDFQAVIKPLGQLFRGIPAVSSSTILGDGSVALILDIPNLMARAHARGSDANAPRAAAEALHN